MNVGLEPVTDDNVGMISPRAMSIPAPKITNPRIGAFLIISVNFRVVFSKKTGRVSIYLSPFPGLRENTLLASKADTPGVNYR